MFPQQPQQQFRIANADVQLFYTSSTWAKPPGVSQIYMMLIGGGGTNSTTSGGGSGAVTTWWGSAQNVPDNLVVTVSTGSSVNTVVQYRGTNGLNDLLTANAGTTGPTAGTAMTANQFCASGFFQSVAGQSSGGASTTASTTTFLGAGAGAGSATSNYGYTTSANGLFQLQPVIVGLGSAGGQTIPGAIGCGGSRSSGPGGPGLVIIASW